MLPKARGKTRKEPYQDVERWDFLIVKICGVIPAVVAELWLTRVGLTTVYQAETRRGIVERLVRFMSTIDGRVDGRGGVLYGVRRDVDGREKHGASSVRARGAIPDGPSMVTMKVTRLGSLSFHLLRDTLHDNR